MTQDTRPREYINRSDLLDQVEDDYDEALISIATRLRNLSNDLLAMRSATLSQSAVENFTAYSEQAATIISDVQATFGSLQLSSLVRCAVAADNAARQGTSVRLSPVISLTATWKPGERVEAVNGGAHGRALTLRPGTVERIDRVEGYREQLVVAFDDGETRPINPDVVRHIR